MATIRDGEKQSRYVLSGPPLTEAEVAGADLPLASYLVQKLAAHGDRVLQVVLGQEWRADWMLRQAAAELSALWRAVPGLREGDTVAVCVGRSALFAPALLAALCSGAVCAVVNAALPHESLHRVLHDLKPVAVLCQPQFDKSASDAKPADCPLQVLGSAESVADAQQLLMRSAQGLKADNTAPAVALLSSGTTGHPKIIRIPRRTLAPTVMFMPPNQWVSLARHCPEDRLRPALQQVRVCMTGGAALKAEAHAWIEARTGRPLTQWYGQTEAFPLCMVVSRQAPAPHGSVGRVSAGMQAKVLDLQTGKRLGPGVDGELCFKGWGFSEEYTDKEGWVHTGDVGHYDADGNFYVVDRVKELVKYRGVHVSPSELEAWLLGHPQVSEAVVVGLPHDEDQEHPAAFVVLAQGATVTPDELKQLVKEKACGSEEKLLHGGVFLVESIPRVASGKVSRGQLRRALLERVTGRA
ncbi:4-coumarate--CoA ligase 1-like [Schistocerca piceifrons]|uniref:4-coumarate--CoA ligase 1-like n=1 Tax=Schistocerca piceifrons TaxID=274613 RepID=UPI001F5FAE3B|nr:4-coumarate--CoA ligase 1-like [Schistocerca piceifrons]